MRLLSQHAYDQMLRESREAERQRSALEERIRELDTANQDLQDQLAQLAEARLEIDRLKRENGELNRRIESTLDEEISKAIHQTGLGKEGFQKLVRDRQELIELYVRKLYSLAKQMSVQNRKIGHNRGLFLVLVDRKNMADDNFSPFHERQEEYLDDERFEHIEQVPHIFAEAVNNVLSYMAEKVEVRDESGRVTGHRERDGALLIDLRGVVFRSCQMVEGVRTHKVYDRVERLRKGSARHNAAIYASSLDEVMASIVISEETSEVTLFRDGKFIQTYDPYTDVEEIRKEEKKVVSIQRDSEKDPIKLAPKPTGGSSEQNEPREIEKADAE